MSDRVLDIVIPVHSPDRPIARAVGSVLRQTDAPNVQVSVVCHGLNPEIVRTQLGSLATDPRVNLHAFSDGIPSPAGPKNFGIASSTATYITFLDSDDEIEAGAIDAWLTEIRAGPDVHIGCMSSVDNGVIFAPLTRWRRTSNLDPVKDLLNYRTAPVGVLIARRVFEDGAPGFTPDLRIGEDIETGSYLWNTSRFITASHCSAGYLIHSDASDRVTNARLEMHDLLKPVRRLLSQPWFQDLSDSRRAAAAVKFLRVQVLGHLGSLAASGSLRSEDLMGSVSTSVALLHVSKRVERLLSIADRKTIETIIAGHVDEAAVLLKARATGTERLLTRILPTSPRVIFHPDSFLRRMIRARMQSRRGGKVSS